MTIINGGDQLLKISPAEILAESPFANFRKQLSTFSEFHNVIDLRLRREHLMKAHDMRMTQPAHDRNLPLNMLHETTFQYLLLAYRLNRHALSRPHIPSMINLCKSTTTQKLPDLIFPE
ncbi:hypothetical protein H5410_053390 [Solanum commersonii]|uniref:Uncharacterized protein n=1 Tax=Solanum commersonii TaxID=4109 RepID=A0A9J5X3Q4_SOLCO|nr:hypothetical protein H5410_053390 [Solanum commersonii]